jgi:N-methylhydantoinase B/oxoprolinase/acetone carboxylase alpha subunit
VNYAIPVIAGLMYRDSVEIDELKHPFRVESLGLVADSAGAGRHRGAPAQEVTCLMRCTMRHASIFPKRSLSILPPR